MTRKERDWAAFVPGRAWLYKGCLPAAGVAFVSAKPLRFVPDFRPVVSQVGQSPRLAVSQFEYVLRELLQFMLHCGKMGKADEYRAHAETAVRLAASTANPADKALLLAIGQGWLDLARMAEAGRLDEQRYRAAPARAPNENRQSHKPAFS
jgi:hypothetical protein